MQEVAAEYPDTQKPKKKADAEFSAIKRIAAILDTLPESARRRVLSYHVDRVIPTN